MAQEKSGAQALAQAALDAGVDLVTSYPGAPITGIVETISASKRNRQPCVLWMSNEKTAIEAAYGASLAGLRALLCVKSVGLNLALDPLMVMNLAGCCAGFVILVGDDPGGWGSQNEQDSRWYAQASELPLLEPCSVADAYVALREAFILSEQLQLPILVRITRALAQAGEGLPSHARRWDRLSPQPGLDCVGERRVVLPVDVVGLHAALQAKMNVVQSHFEGSPLNGVQGSGDKGVISVGFMHRKLLSRLNEQVPAGLRVLHIGTVNPLPHRLVMDFLQDVALALILEEGAPIVESILHSLQENLPQAPSILGRLSGHIPPVGELMPSQLSAALAPVLPDFNGVPVENEVRPMPSREVLCEGCPYPLVFDALTALISGRTRQEKVKVVGDPGCMVRAQLPPYNLLDVKTSLGSSVAMAAGIALRNEMEHQGYEAHTRLIALVGDSGFFHSGLQGLIDARRMGVNMLVVVLDNGVTALSGGQPHPGSRKGHPASSGEPIDLRALIRHLGIEQVRLVDLDQGQDVQIALGEAWDEDGLSVVIARGDCKPEGRPPNEAVLR